MGEKIARPKLKKTIDPCVVLILPLDGANPQAEAQKSVITAEQFLLASHPADIVAIIIRRLRRLIKQLNHPNARPSVAIFASEKVESFCYMDFKVERQIVVDEPFRVRDLVRSQRRNAEFLVLELGGKESQLYYGYKNPISLVKARRAESVYAYLNEVPERTANFSDPDARREVMMDKYLHYIDEDLGELLKTHVLPIIVTGPERISGHFAAITHHSKHVAAYLHKDFPPSAHQQLLDSISAELDHLEAADEQITLLQIQSAVNAGRLEDGLDQVQEAAEGKNCRLLVFEKSEPKVFYKESRIDEIAEKVLDNGGEIKAVRKGVLDAYHQIALIRYY